MAKPPKLPAFIGRDDQQLYVLEGNRLAVASGTKGVSLQSAYDSSEGLGLISGITQQKPIVFAGETIDQESPLFFLVGNTVVGQNLNELVEDGDTKNINGTDFAHRLFIHQGTTPTLGIDGHDALTPPVAYFYRSLGSPENPTPVLDGLKLAAIHGFGFTGQHYGWSAGIEFVSTSNHGIGNTSGAIHFRTTASGSETIGALRGIISEDGWDFRGHQLYNTGSYTPTGTADSEGEEGEITWDDDFLYVKTSVGWKRAALSVF